MVPFLTSKSKLKVGRGRVRPVALPRWAWARLAPPERCMMAVLAATATRSMPHHSQKLGLGNVIPFPSRPRPSSKGPSADARGSAECSVSTRENPRERAVRVLEHYALEMNREIRTPRRRPRDRSRLLHRRHWDSSEPGGPGATVVARGDKLIDRQRDRSGHDAGCGGVAKCGPALDGSRVFSEGNTHRHRPRRMPTTLRGPGAVEHRPRRR